MNTPLYLTHSGTPHEGSIPHSGRYPYGSGDAAYQRAGQFYKQVRDLRKQGYSDRDIAKMLNYVDRHGDPDMTAFNHKFTVSRAQQWTYDSWTATKLHDMGYSNVQIAKKMGCTEGKVRTLLDENLQERNLVIESTAAMIKEQVDKYGYIDVGKGAELSIPTYAGIGITETRLNDALYLLQEEGYPVYGDIKVPQVTNKSQNTTVKVITRPGVTKAEAYQHRGDIQPLTPYSEDGGKTFEDFQFPASLDSNRLQICYAEDGGKNKDGIIELRRGVADLDLGPDTHYAQVRIAVDGTHYLKGVAMYRDDMPDGVDVIFNTNKTSDVPKMEVLKGLKKDPVTGEVDKILPFGSVIKRAGQSYYDDPNGIFEIDGAKKSLSLINKVNEEGDWNNWGKTIASQWLSKQRKELIEQRLNVTYDEKKGQLSDIMEITNDTIRKQKLLEFSEDLDAAAVHLKAVGFPRQRQQVILPCDIPENKIYAPNFENGEEVVLIRYPHAGYFESPRLIVDNNNPAAKSILGGARDAVGINPKVAEVLSGADFDGDTVTVIPTKGQLPIKARESVKGNDFASLKDFDPKEQYKGYTGMKVISKKTQQAEMGKVSNLITDMTLKGAPPEHIERAVRHSMVVIDAEKHKLDYQKSYKDNGIAELKQMYQDGGGAATLISKARSIIRDIPERKQWFAKESTPESPTGIDPKTGEKVYAPTNREYTNKFGNTVRATESGTRMGEAKDARELSSGTVAEELYANYANKLKALANETRKLYLATPETKANESAKKTYAAEVESLKAKVLIAEKNAPRERMAQIIANSIYKSKVEDNPEIESDAQLDKKVRSRALAEARATTGANKARVIISEKEWEAIQAGAIGSTTLKKIMDNAAAGQIEKYAMPSKTNKLTSGQQSRMRSYINAGYSASEIAKALGVSVSTVYDFAKEDGKDI